jgi:hypothetical protein
MASPTLALTNKENAQHSTGPKTEAGKRASSLNATRHGLTGQAVVLPTEDAARYEAFRIKLLADLHPQGATEDLLAQTIVDTEWRAERARALEANIFALAHYEELSPQIASVEDETKRRALTEAHAAIKHEKVLRNLHIQEARLQRLLLRSLSELRDQQARRRDKLMQAQDAKMFHEHNKLPYDQSSLGFVFTDSEYNAEFTRRTIHRAPPQTFVVPRVGLDR